MDLAELTDRLKSAVSGDTGLNKTLKLDFGSVGKIFVDPAASDVSNEDKPADCTLQLSWDDFQQMAAGKLDPTMAFMQGKLKVLGDMSVAMKLQPLIAKLR
jgi:putative sterol carrier protein